MKRQWTPEQRAMQAKLIQRWKPWQQTTGPKTPSGKARIAKNAYKGGSRPALRAAVQTLKLAMADQLRFLHGVDL